jgi:hypothetical protein
MGIANNPEPVEGLLRAQDKWIYSQRKADFHLP